MKQKILDKMEENYEADIEEIGKQIKEGSRSGILDNEYGYRTSWTLVMTQFEYQ